MSMKNTFFFLIMLKFLIKIKGDEVIHCHERCLTCSSNFTSTSNECDTCISGTYLVEGEKNCFHEHEKPDYYIDSTTNILRPCQNNCYQCNESRCLSCIRGYQINQETFECEQCPTDEYIYIMDKIEFCEGSTKTFFTCELKETKCSGKSTNLENFECPREFPLLKEGTNECVLEYLNSSYTKSNQIINTQWINKITLLGFSDCLYILFSSNSKGDYNYIII